MKRIIFKNFAIVSLAACGGWSGSAVAAWGYVSRANCVTINESITWNRTSWDGATKVLYVESWHKRSGAPANTAHRVTDGWERNSQHVRASDNHVYLDYQVIGRHYESLPSGFITQVMSNTTWCNLLSW